MRLDEFVQDLRKYPDEEVGNKVFGDNGRVLVSCAYPELRELIRQIDCLRLNKDQSSLGINVASFFYKPGTVIVDAIDDVRFWEDNSEKGKPYFDLMRARYHSSLGFYVYQGWEKYGGKVQEGVHPNRALANCTIEVCEFLKEKTQFCIESPRIKRNQEDYSLIVWHPDGDEPSPSGRGEGDKT